MNPEARRVITEVRLSRTPSVDDKERIRKALAIGVAVTAASVPATAAGVAAAKAGAAGGVAAKAAGAAGMAVGLKTAVSVVVLASVGAGAYVLTRPEPAPRSHAPKVVAARPAPVPALSLPAPIVEEAPPPVAPVVETHSAPARSGRDPLLAELALLHHAQQAWRQGNASHALSLAQEHAHRYPHSALALERDALRVFALCALGQKAQARPLADDILRRAPNSPLRTSVEESCGR